MYVSRLNDPSYLKGFWPLNNHVNDISSNGNNGTATSVTYTAGTFGRNVGSFNGSSSAVDCGNISSINGSSQLSISIWFYATTYPTQKSLVSKWDYQTQGSWAIETNTNNRLLMYFATSLTDSGTTYVATDNNALIDGTLNHVVFSYNGNNSSITRVSIYLNGVLINTNYTGTIPSYLTSNTATVKIGRWGGTLTRYWNGTHSNVRIYNIALSGTEALALYNIEKNTPKPSRIEQPLNTLPDITDSTLFASYLNNKTRGTYNDYSNNYRTATPGNPTALQRTTRGLRCDGSAVSRIYVVTDGLKVPNATLMAWYKPETLASNARYYFSYEVGFTSRLLFGTTTSGQGFVFDDINDENLSTNIGATGSFVINQWHHVAVVINSNGSKSMYLNGALLGNATQTAYNLSHLTGSAILNFMSSSSAGAGIIGEMFDCRAYSEAKSAAFIADVYAKGVPDSTLLFHTVGGAKDFSRYSRAITNTATVVGDKMKFDGANSYLNLGADFIGTGDITILAWINPNSAGESSVGRIVTNLTKFSFFINTGLRLLASSDNSTNAVSTSVLTANKWQQVAITRTSTGACTFYLNGINITSISASGTPAAGSNVSIGGDSAQTATFDGSISDVKIFSEVKTAGYIQDYYNKTRGAY